MRTGVWRKNERLKTSFRETNWKTSAHWLSMRLNGRRRDAWRRKIVLKVVSQLYKRDSDFVGDLARILIVIYGCRVHGFFIKILKIHAMACELRNFDDYKWDDLFVQFSFAILTRQWQLRRCPASSWPWSSSPLSLLWSMAIWPTPTLVSGSSNLFTIYWLLILNCRQFRNGRGWQFGGRFGNFDHWSRSDGSWSLDGSRSRVDNGQEVDDNLLIWFQTAMTGR